MNEFLFENIRFAPMYFGNTLDQYASAVALFSLSLLAFLILQWVLLRWLERLAKKTKNDLDDTLIRIVHNIRPAFYYFFAAYIGLWSLSLSDMFRNVLDGALIVVVAYQVVIALHVLVDYTLKKRAAREGEGAKNAFRFLGNFIKWGLWLVAILTVLANLGINVTSMIAGLGIGGIAVALALQNILSDLFSSFAIYLDKPFEKGDFIIVGEHMGTVERIGIKTTRLRALQGEEVVISNQELTSTRVQNFKKMHERRIAFQFGVIYDTPPESVQAIPEMVKELFIELGTRARLDRVHFSTFADSSLLFEVVYYVPSGDYNEYMDLQQDINFKLLGRFAQEKISFAFPTRTVHIVK